MKVVFAPLARRELRKQVQYLIDHGGTLAAQRLKSRVMTFVKETLATFPEIGTPMEHRDLYETWVPGTQLVIWYRISKTTIEIARVWHAAQDRSTEP